MVDGDKICLRTDIETEKFNGVIKAIEEIKEEIDHVLVANHTGNFS
jgi:hypothetical protein